MASTRSEFTSVYLCPILKARPNPYLKEFDMDYKYCSNCKQENLQERSFCFFCEGSAFVDSLGELTGKSEKKKIVPRLIEKVEEIIERKESVVKEKGQELLMIKVDAGQFEELIEAQNRTTHAVRAFVRFLFIQLSGISLAVVLWNLSLSSVNQQECFNSGEKCGANSFLQITAVLVWIVSVIWSSIAGWDELDKSKVN